MRVRGHLWAIGVLMLAACSGGQERLTVPSSTTASTEAPSGSTTDVATTSTSAAYTTEPVSAVDLAVAESFVDAFYSFDSAALVAVMDSAESSQPSIVFYQGWAEGANYQVVNRQSCAATAQDTAECPVTVEDDFATILEFGFNVTDTFRLTFEDGAIVAVETTSDDPPLMEEFFAWMFQNQVELFEPGGPCEGFFDGGPTPGKCAASFVAGSEEFADSKT